MYNSIHRRPPWATQETRLETRSKGQGKAFARRVAVCTRGITSGSDLETRRVNRPRKHNKLEDNKRSAVRWFTIIMPSIMPDPLQPPKPTRNEQNSINSPLLSLSLVLSRLRLAPSPPPPAPPPLPPLSPALFVRVVVETRAPIIVYTRARKRAVISESEFPHPCLEDIIMRPCASPPLFSISRESSGSKSISRVDFSMNFQNQPRFSILSKQMLIRFISTKAIIYQQRDDFDLYQVCEIVCFDSKSNRKQFINLSFILLFPNLT